MEIHHHFGIRLYGVLLQWFRLCSPQASSSSRFLIDIISLVEVIGYVNDWDEVIVNIVFVMTGYVAVRSCFRSATFSQSPNVVVKSVYDSMPVSHCHTAVTLRRIISYVALEII